MKINSSLDGWLDQLNQRLSCERSSVMLQIPGDDHLEIVAHRGYIVAPELHLPIGHGIAGIVAETGEAEIVNDVEFDPRFVTEGHNIKKLLCVPVKNKNQVVGVVNLSNPETVDQFQTMHIKWVQDFLMENPIDRHKHVRPEV